MVDCKTMVDQTFSRPASIIITSHPSTIPDTQIRVVTIQRKRYTKDFSSIMRARYIQYCCGFRPVSTRSSRSSPKTPVCLSSHSDRRCPSFLDCTIIKCTSMAMYISMDKPTSSAGLLPSSSRPPAARPTRRYRYILPFTLIYR
jgi:hypothetical protein